MKNLKEIDVYLNSLYIFIILISQVAIIDLSIYEFPQSRGQVTAFASGLKGDAATRAQYNTEEKVKDWERNYWVEVLEISLVVIGIPLLVSLVRLWYRDKLWVNIIYYMSLIFFMGCFVACFRTLFWRWY